MKSFLTLFLVVACIIANGQRSDFIVLKKRNNRTVKTYFPGTFLSALTYSNFRVNGLIRDIRNDTVFVEQQEVFQVPTQFGVQKLDTLIHTIRFHYTDIKQFFFSNNTGIGGAPRKRGFAQVTLPRLMVLGGSAFIALELVNTAYRKESLNDGKKISSLAIAAAIAGGGLIWQQLQNQAGKAGGKFKVVYVK
ncbi:MAG TPA: hypothetical protein VM012_02710 [Flavitalea sp.]|nr:hypothetical protein [Flavitalea sp.]